WPPANAGPGRADRRRCRTGRRRFRRRKSRCRAHAWPDSSRAVGRLGKTRQDAVQSPVLRTGMSMPTVRIKENEPFDVALRRFKRTIEKAGVITELRSREYYEKPTAERKRKKAAAVKRHFKRLRSQMLPKKLY